MYTNPTIYDRFLVTPKGPKTFKKKNRWIQTRSAILARRPPRAHATSNASWLRIATLLATKPGNRDLLAYDTSSRLAFALLPLAVARVVDLRTSLMPEWIAATGDLVAAGYEVGSDYGLVIVHVLLAFP